MLKPCRFYFAKLFRIDNRIPAGSGQNNPIFKPLNKPFRTIQYTTMVEQTHIFSYDSARSAIWRFANSPNR